MRIGFAIFEDNFTLCQLRIGIIQKPNSGLTRAFVPLCAALMA
jgi:hypothetical protein